MTTANYAPSALQKAATSLPRVLTLNGDQIVSVMVEHGLGLRPSPNHAERLDIDPDYFLAFEAMKGLLSHHVAEARQGYHLGSRSDPFCLIGCILLGGSLASEGKKIKVAGSSV